MEERKIAFFSDIHSNNEALQAVLRDMQAQKVTERICLGDIVGYGPNPAECVKAVQELGCPVVKGNHDEEVSGNESLDIYRDVVRAGLEWSRKLVTPEQKDWLRALPYVHETEELTAVHSSLFEPVNWHYVFEQLDAERHFSQQHTRISFCGHTHMPVIWRHQVEYRERAVGAIIELDPNYHYLINVGSVGQPRDMNYRACYLIYYPDKFAIQFRRVIYDVTRVQQKIMIAGLPKFLAQRLALGK
ncbi:MAG: metallophosphoesterase [Candidatus Methylacidiphilales bacterium]|nr:metallophosphoesterase family protein [Candidatus Methylacidiphilales bacterium]